MAGISVALNLLGIISVCRAVPFSDMIDYIIGFRLAFGNLLLGFIKLTVWTSYSIYRRSCCPDSAYYLGSSRRLSDTYIKTTRVTTEVTRRRRADGTIISENRREVGREDLGTRKVDISCV
ncbi:uncharacterized protein LOC128551456 [Mercenaria mercenaria]|uniref:uncharacterized protein LOC128551456 n=1 Tax=Mercenaria mercenaria TaxID=6596 RepID=UPI00234EBA37|nr:uncharacterized protein LOC128551456 [Mercenaria mercenaria]